MAVDDSVWFPIQPQFEVVYENPPLAADDGWKVSSELEVLVEGYGDDDNICVMQPYMIGEMCQKGPLDSPVYSCKGVWTGDVKFHALRSTL